MKNATSPDPTLNPVQQRTSTIELVKALSQGRCSCYHPMGSCIWSYNHETGETTSKSDPGPRAECLRCRARRALEADGIAYEKVDHLPLRVSI